MIAFKLFIKRDAHTSPKNVPEKIFSNKEIADRKKAKNKK